jgi:hypothetical protein
VIESTAVHCRDVRDRPQRITVSTVDGQVRMALLPAETARLTPVEALWLADALRDAAGPKP